MTPSQITTTEPDGTRTRRDMSLRSVRGTIFSFDSVDFMLWFSWGEGSAAVT